MHILQFKQTYDNHPFPYRGMLIQPHYETMMQL